MPVEPRQPKRRNNDRHGPAHQHRHDLHAQQQERRHEEDILPEQKADDAFPHETRIGIKEGIQAEPGNQTGRRRACGRLKPKDSGSNRATENDLPEIIFPIQAAKGLVNKFCHAATRFR